MTDSNTQLSVMAPVGAALLGLRVGDSIHWELPAALQPTLKCWNSNTSQKLLATTCFNPICSDDSLPRGCTRILFPLKYQPDLSFCS